MVRSKRCLVPGCAQLCKAATGSIRTRKNARVPAPRCFKCNTFSRLACLRWARGIVSQNCPPVSDDASMLNRRVARPHSHTLHQGAAALCRRSLHGQAHRHTCAEVWAPHHNARRPPRLLVKYSCATADSLHYDVRKWAARRKKPRSGTRHPPGRQVSKSARGVHLSAWVRPCVCVPIRYAINQCN